MIVWIEPRTMRGLLHCGVRRIPAVSLYVPCDQGSAGAPDPSGIECHSESRRFAPTLALPTCQRWPQLRYVSFFPLPLEPQRFLIESIPLPCHATRRFLHRIFVSCVHRKPSSLRSAQTDVVTHGFGVLRRKGALFRVKLSMSLEDSLSASLAPVSVGPCRSRSTISPGNIG